MKRAIFWIALLGLCAGMLPACGKKEEDASIQLLFRSENALEGATVADENWPQGGKPTANALLQNNSDCWQAQDPNRHPADGQEDICYAYAELKLKNPATFNTAVIEEVGEEALYFRLQVFADETWKTIYQCEKLSSLRVCSFDAATTDRVRLVIDKFRSSETPAQIRSLRLYNEPKRPAGDLHVTVYQRLDQDVPTQTLARGEEFAKIQARYYDVYNTVLIFGAIQWDENGNLLFNCLGDAQEDWDQPRREEEFGRQLAALKELIALRSNQNHEVKIICTGLADGAPANTLMKQHRDKIADTLAGFAAKYELDGLDIDWEYPNTQEDWDNYDAFITRLHSGMEQQRPGAILSAALSAWALKMRPETLALFDQIQFMAYDGGDRDGFQSGMQQAVSGLLDFARQGADISKINIGIAAYGRPLNSAPFWKPWRSLETANYWDCKYLNVPDAGQVYDGTFCSPALAGDKLAYALFSGAGGVMVFRLACDKRMDDPNSVTRGLENALNRYVDGW
ncbi:MAG: glycoside hydrolase family 18 protein [Oscillospiraceae bacterium]|jgi:hypothetical protein|nr:glycoside hydrolase family 18 protein [Oscillospiraceae bacterium]